MGRALCLMILGFAGVCHAVDAPSLAVIASYRTETGVYEAVLKNVTDRAVDTAVAAVTNADSGMALSPWWVRLDPATLPPGSVARLAVLPREPLASGVGVRVALAVGDQTVPVLLSPAAGDGRLAYVAYDDTRGIAYAYVRNTSDGILTASNLRIAGQAVPSAEQAIPSGAVGLLSGPISGLKPGGNALVEVDLGGTSRGWIAPLVDTGAFAIGPEDAQWIMRCPTHLHGTYEEAGVKLFGLVDSQPDLPRTLHLCRANYADGLHVFSRCVETLRISPQGVARQTGSSPTAEALYAIIREAKRAVEPGRLECVLELEQAEGKGEATLVVSTADAEIALWASIAAGAKAIYFRGEDRARIQRFVTNLMPLQPLLGRSEPAEMAVACTGGYQARLLSCGPEISLVILLPSSENAPQNVSVRLDAPMGQAALVYGAGSLATPESDEDDPGLRVEGARGCLVVMIMGA